jgi:hypothetical protein
LIIEAAPLLKVPESPKPNMPLTPQTTTVPVVQNNVRDNEEEPK